MVNPFNTGYYYSEELQEFNFKHIGKNVEIAKNCTIVEPQNLWIGDYVRVDATTTIIATGPVRLEGRNHVGGFCHLVGRGGLTLERYAGLSQRTSVYTANDDYTGRYMTGPMIPEAYTSAAVSPVTFRQHVIVGSGSVILPGCDIGEGSAVGALSLVTKSLEPWGVYSGSPLRRIKDRSRQLLIMAAELEAIETVQQI